MPLPFFLARALPCAALCVGLATLAGPANAHETLPASLTLRAAAQPDVAAGVRAWDVSWRLPALQGRAPAIVPRLPADCVRAMPRAAGGAVAAPPAMPGAIVQRWTVRCASDPAQGFRIGFDGLPATSISVLVQLEAADGRHWSALATPRQPEVALARPQSAPLATGSYFRLGVDHILGGIDHLLFVLCLVLLVSGRAQLLKTISAFTLAHSITLALAATGQASIPQAPVEASIALSIAFLARELVRPAATAAKPWLAAFAFGLLHGLGFAGALAEVGLPPGQVPQALLLFNLGVEAGQLAFVAAATLALAALARAGAGTGRKVQQAAAYVVGGVAMYWTLQRMAPIFN